MDTARLAGVTRLRVDGRVPCDVFVFDPHRLALPSWAACVSRPGALLVSLDRHFDLVPPPAGAPIPRLGDSLQRFDEYTRWEADVRNVDQILTALEGGLFSAAIAVARSDVKGVQPSKHRVLTAPTLRSLIASGEFRALLLEATSVVLDIDLDCFTTLSDADPTSVLPWPEELIRDYLNPPGSAEFWGMLWPKLAGIMISREPLHCGGLIEAGRLFERFSQVLFVELLGADLP